MNPGKLRSGRSRWLMCAWLLVGALAACGKGGKESPAALTQGSLTADEPKMPEALGKAPFTELDFVPRDTEALIRVDLAKLSAADPARQDALDFLLRAQQPVIWETLRAAGVRPGRELTAVYLLVSSKPAGGDAFVIGAVGQGPGSFDRARLSEALVATGPTVEKAGAGEIYTWPPDTDATTKVGAALPPEKQKLGRAAVGLDANLILVGPPELVRAALTTRAGEHKDARHGALAAQLTAVDASAPTWGVAATGNGSFLRMLVPGLERARFHSTMAHGVAGDVALRAEFASETEAKAFGDELKRQLDHVAPLADKTPVGAALRKLRATGIKVEGKIVRAE